MQRRHANSARADKVAGTVGNIRVVIASPIAPMTRQEGGGALESSRLCGEARLRRFGSSLNRSLGSAGRRASPAQTFEGFAHGARRYPDDAIERRIHF